MGDLYLVDFKEKELKEFLPKIPYKAYSWKCDICNTVYRYDTRKETNTRYITIETHLVNVDLCEHCIRKAHDMISEIY